MKTRRFPFIPFVLPMLAVALLLVVGCAETGLAAPLQLQVAFDNEYVSAAQPEARYLEVLVTAAETAAQRPRVPLNLALVIDTSGSMNDQGKLDYVKQAALALIDRLRPEDRFALIAYSTKARVLFPSQRVEQGQQMQWLINSLEATGGTNLGEGLLEGYREVRNYASPAMTNRVLLLSDGLANIGITSSAELSRLVLDQAEAGISLSSFGVGLEFNEDLMAAVAESGRGMYYFIDHPESMNSILSKEFKSVEQLAAADIKVNIVIGSDLVIDQVFANSFTVNGNTVSVRFGDLAGGERRRLQIRLLPRQRGAGRSDNAAQVNVSCLLPGSSSALALSQNIGLIYTEDTKTAAAHQDKEVSERSAVFEANQAKKEAALAVDKGDQGRAAVILGEAKKKIEAAAPSASVKVQDELTKMDSYAKNISKPMEAKERALEQKQVKHRVQEIEGC